MNLNINSTTSKIQITGSGKVHNFKNWYTYVNKKIGKWAKVLNGHFWGGGNTWPVDL